MNINGQTKCGTSTHSGILFSHAKEGNTDACYNMALENMMPSERNQTRSPYNVRVHLQGIFRTGKSIETNSKSVVAKA